ncbi:YbaB/EbfC family nucleoid-associated protein [Actinokineospora bangkokensis]|uniref:YbaB/EbfC DNA-binding family protein n=1 Tax=Actinokineospora bangkokensis TaxID=1193682 RepID=A0A1Q9LIL8_9PSEU|nr:YbaB/EbfC family nucleoid-associated protein [Actinokineospora bangkokensis]OLR91819.1 hypothetical protein BJP25_23550 [Actinokineospora bangkokensis]
MEPLDQLRARVADIQARAAALTERVHTEQVTVASPDRSVTVTVGITGALEDITLGHRACDLGPARLTQLIKQTVGAARSQAAHRAAEAFAPLGAGTEAMSIITKHFPPDRVPDAPDQTLYHAAEDPPPLRQPAPVRRQPPPPRRPARQHPVDDEDDVDLW